MMNKSIKGQRTPNSFPVSLRAFSATEIITFVLREEDKRFRNLKEEYFILSKNSYC